MAYGIFSFNRLHYVQYFFERNGIAYLFILSEKVQSTFTKIRVLFFHSARNYVHYNHVYSSKNFYIPANSINGIADRKQYNINLQCTSPVLNHEKGQEVA